MSDGRFLVEFYVCHPKDNSYNAANQRYWLEYHKRTSRYQLHQNYYLIKPTPNCATHIERLNVIPFRQWVTIHDPETYILGPFDFATIHGRKTKDRIDPKHWKQLIAHQSKFSNEIPSLKFTPHFSYHVNTPPYQTFHCDNVIKRIRAITELSYFLEEDHESLHFAMHASAL